MHCLGISKYSNLAGITWMKQMFAKQELFSVLCIKNSCEPWQAGGIWVRRIPDKAVVPRVLTFFDVPLLSCRALLHTSMEEWQDHLSFGNKIVVTAVSSRQQRSDDVNLSPDLLGSPYTQ